MKRRGFWFRFLGLHTLDGFGSLVKVFLGLMGIVLLIMALKLIFYIFAGAF